MFSGAVTSSPMKRKLRSDFCHSPDVSLLSPDSSYLLDCSDGAPCCCRRSPRLLTNGYYDVTQGSFTWDQDGNVSLTPGKTNVCYKENLVRIFRRRRRPHSALVSLLHDVKDNCQSWLDHSLFRGVFGSNHCQDLNQDQNKDLSEDLSSPPSLLFSPDRPRWDQDQTHEQDLDWSRTDLDEPMWTRLNSTEMDERTPFVYDPTEVPPPLDKHPIQEEPCPDTCQSQDTFSQSVGGLSEVPPSQGCCCQSPEQDTGLTLRGFLLFIFTIFIMAALYSRCLWWSSAVASTVFITLSTSMILTKSGPMGEWRKAKTEDITSRNE